MNLAVVIKNTLGIVNDNFHVDGVGENDLLIVSTAAVHALPLVSDEKVQNTKPLYMARYKIPTVCELDNVSVSCNNFVDFIKQSGVVFG